MHWDALSYIAFKFRNRGKIIEDPNIGALKWKYTKFCWIFSRIVVLYGNWILWWHSLRKSATCMLLDMFHLMLCIFHFLLVDWVYSFCTDNTYAYHICMNRFLLGGIELLSYYLVPSSMALGLTFGLQLVYLLNFFFVDPFCR